MRGWAMVVLVLLVLGCGRREVTAAAPVPEPSSVASASAPPAVVEPPDSPVTPEIPLTVAKIGEHGPLVTDGTEVFWIDTNGVKAISADSMQASAPRTVSTKSVVALAAGPGVLFATTSEAVQVQYIPGATSLEPSIPLDRPVRGSIIQLVPPGRKDPVYGTIVGYDVTSLTVTPTELVWRESGYSDILGFIQGEERRMPLPAAPGVDAPPSVRAKPVGDRREVKRETRRRGGGEGGVDAAIRDDAGIESCSGLFACDERHQYWLEPSDHTLRRRRRTERGAGVTIAEHLGEAGSLLAAAHTLYWLEPVKGSKKSWMIQAVSKP